MGFGCFVVMVGGVVLRYGGVVVCGDGNGGWGGGGEGGGEEEGEEGEKREGEWEVGDVHACL